MPENKFLVKIGKYDTELQQPFNLGVALTNFCIKHIIAGLVMSSIRAYNVAERQ